MWDRLKTWWAALRRRRSWGLRYWQPNRFFWLNAVYVAILAVLLIGREAEWLRIDEIPNRLGDLIPVAIPWFGALGAVMSSLYGVFEHNREWDRKWNYWHAARPFVGAVFAVVAFLMFIGFINATGLHTGADDNGVSSALPTDAQHTIPYLVISFIVGFREETFRALLKRVVDIILGPGVPGQTPYDVTLSASPHVLKHGQLNHELESVSILVANNGKEAVNTTAANAHALPHDAAEVTVDHLGNKVVQPSSHIEGELKVTPKKNRHYKVIVEVTGSFGTRTIEIERA